MSGKTCISCGGIIGRDCFNPQECALITQQQAIEEYARNYSQTYDNPDYADYMRERYA